MRPLGVTHHWPIFLWKWGRHIHYKVKGDTVPALYGIDVNDVWFQEDSITCYTSHATIDLLHQTFDSRLINRNGDVNWVPRNCNLIWLDYFLWSAVKEKCYADKSSTIKHLKANMHENWSDRIMYYEVCCGSYMNEIIFHF